LVPTLLGFQPQGALTHGGEPSCGQCSTNPSETFGSLGSIWLQCSGFDEGIVSLIEASRTQCCKAGAHRLRVVVVAERGVGACLTRLRRRVIWIQEQCLTVVLRCSCIVACSFGVLCISEERQQRVQILRTPLTIRGAPVGWIDPPGEIKRLTGYFLLTRPQSFLAGDNLC